jgi:hypothetical protein
MTTGSVGALRTGGIRAYHLVGWENYADATLARPSDARRL